MKKKNRGFTLIEILAAITILGIISVVAAISVNKIIQNAKIEHYNVAENELKISGQSYVQQNRNKLPKTIGQKTKIPLKTLVENNYIKQIKDYNDNNCDPNKSYVQVFKYSQSDYSYFAYLDCPTYTSKEKIEKGSPIVSIMTTNPSLNKSPTASINITDSEKLLSWSYIIYKDGKEVKNSGSIYLKDYPKILNETISLAKYTPSKIKIVVTATNIYGLTTTKTNGNVDYQDKQGPTCIIKEKDQKSHPKNWTKGPVTITVGCDDGAGAGCTKKEFTKTFKTTTDIGKITIEDKKGNKTTCEVSVNIDITPPTCSNITKLNNTSGTDYFSNSWTNQNIYTSATCADKNSGCSTTKKVTTTGATGNQSKASNDTYTVSANGTSTTTWYVYDAVGNETPCTTITEKKDTTPPTITPSTKLSVKSNITGVITDNVGLAGYTITTSRTKPTKWTTISGTSVTKTESKDSGTYYIHAIDVAGNWSYVEQKVVALEPPTCTITLSGTTGENSYYKSNVTVKLITSGTVTTKGLATYANATNGKTSVTHTSDTNGITYYGHVSNAAGSSSCQKTFKKDSTKPTISYQLTKDGGENYYSGTWTNRAVTRRLMPYDATSGVAETQYNTGSGWIKENNVASHRYGEGISSVSFRVKDKAGNYSNTINLSFLIDWTPPVYTNIYGSCGGVAGSQTWKVEVYFSDTLSGLGKRNVTGWDINNHTKFKEINYNGAGRAGDLLGTGGSWYSFDHMVCDVAGNCSSKSMRSVKKPRC